MTSSPEFFRVLGDQSWNGEREALLYDKIGKKQDTETMSKPFLQSRWPPPSLHFLHHGVNKIKLFVWAGGAAIKKIRRAAREFQMQTKVCFPSLEMHSMFWFPLILIIIFWLPSYFSDISANPFIRMISPSVASSCHQRVKTSSQHKLFNDVSGNVSILQLHCSFVYSLI